MSKTVRNFPGGTENKSLTCFFTPFASRFFVGTVFFRFRTKEKWEGELRRQSGVFLHDICKRIFCKNYFSCFRTKKKWEGGLKWQSEVFLPGLKIRLRILALQFGSKFWHWLERRIHYRFLRVSTWKHAFIFASDDVPPSSEDYSSIDLCRVFLLVYLFMGPGRSQNFDHSYYLPRDFWPSYPKSFLAIYCQSPNSTSTIPISNPNPHHAHPNWSGQPDAP